MDGIGVYYGDVSLFEFVAFSVDENKAASFFAKLNFYVFVPIVTLAGQDRRAFEVVYQNERRLPRSICVLFVTCFYSPHPPI